MNIGFFPPQQSTLYSGPLKMALAGTIRLTCALLTHELSKNCANILAVYSYDNNHALRNGTKTCLRKVSPPQKITSHLQDIAVAACSSMC